MEGNIKIQSDYTKLTLQSLKYLYSLTPREAAARYRVFAGMVEKYFEMRLASDTSFNIYSFIRKHKIDGPMMISLLSQEFGFGDLSNLPREYYGDFFWLLTETVSFLEDGKKKGESSFEWTFTNPTQIISLLKKVKKADIPDLAVFAKINQLIKLIEESLESPKTEETKFLPGESPKNELSLPEDPAAQVKKIKITPSQLTKGKVREIFESFKDYDEETQNQIIAASLKKWNSFEGLRPHYIFAYLKENPTSGHDPLVAFNDVINTYSRPYEVLGYKDPEEMVAAISVLYSTFAGATEAGRKYYIACLHQKLNGGRKDEGSNSFYAEHYLRPALGILRKYKDKSWIDLFGYQITLKRVFTLKDFVCKMVTDGNYVIKEPNFEEEIQSEATDYLFRVIEKLRNNLFETSILYLNESEKDDRFFAEYEKESRELLGIVRSLTLSGADMLKIYGEVRGDKTYRYFTGNNNLARIFYTHFCNHQLNKEQATEFVDSIEKVEAFKFCAQIYRNSGSYHSYEDFLSVILVECIDSFTLKCEDSLRLFTELIGSSSGACASRKIIIHRRKDYEVTLTELILEKIKADRPDIMEFIDDYFDAAAMPINNIRDFLKTFI